MNINPITSYGHNHGHDCLQDRPSTHFYPSRPLSSLTSIIPFLPKTVRARIRVQLLAHVRLRSLPFLNLEGRATKTGQGTSQFTVKYSFFGTVTQPLACWLHPNLSRFWISWIQLNPASPFHSCVDKSNLQLARSSVRLSRCHLPCSLMIVKCAILYFTIPYCRMRADTGKDGKQASRTVNQSTHRPNARLVDRRKHPKEIALTTVVVVATTQTVG